MSDYEALCRAIYTFLEDIVEQEWGARPPYTGSFAPMNEFRRALGMVDVRRQDDPNWIRR